MKKIIISLSVIAAVAAIGIGVTVALFSDTETSAGNIFTAGTVDLKVDHVRQTYNDVDCKTCNVTIVSDTSNSVVATVGGADPVSMPHPALLVSHPHVRWTANVGNPNAKWIWATDPTLAADTYGASYTFARTFDWYGPFTGATLNFSVGSDNSVVVYLNGVEIGRNDSEFGYQTPISISFTPAQGANELKFVVTNWNGSHDPAANPGGLLYALTINGNCDNDYFKTNCTLWGEKDLAPGDYFWRLNDVKPGDRGTNIISLHVLGNDAYSCLLVTNPQDTGELSQFLSAVVWADNNPQNNAYDVGETILYGPAALKDIKTMTRFPLTATTTAYVGLAWCFGMQTVDGTGIHCSGVGNQNIAQGDSFLTSLTAYAEQQRNNPNFSCESVNLEPPK